MDKFLKLTWGEVAKWLVLIAGIVTTFTVMQTKIHDLEVGRAENRRKIEDLELRMRLIEGQLAKMDSKLEIIGTDVQDIKSYIINGAVGDRNRNR
jgi:chromosome segregation ATPase